MVIAKRLNNKKGRPKAKVVYILEKAFAYSVVYLTYEYKKGKKVHHTITRFHFLNNLSKFDNTFIIKNLADENGLKNLADIFEIVTKTKDPKAVYEELKNKIDDKTIIELIQNKSGNSLNISSYAMLKFIPYFKQGLQLIR